MSEIKREFELAGIGLTAQQLKKIEKTTNDLSTAMIIKAMAPPPVELLSMKLPGHLETFYLNIAYFFERISKYFTRRAQRVVLRRVKKDGK